MKIRLSPLDKLFSEYIRKRDKVCQRCGGYSKGLHCAHFHSRRYHSVRYDPDNACALDFGCHQYLDSHPFEKIEFFKKRLGERAFDLLINRANSHDKIDEKLIGLYLKSKLKEGGLT